MPRMVDRGSIERKTSENKRVKSKPPRHCAPAYGPNVSSTDAQFWFETEAIEDVDAVVGVPQNFLLCIKCIIDGVRAFIFWHYDNAQGFLTITLIGSAGGRILSPTSAALVSEDLLKRLRNRSSMCGRSSGTSCLRYYQPSTDMLLFREAARRSSTSISVS
jgi:hypothetical protein